MRRESVTTCIGRPSVSRMTRLANPGEVPRYFAIPEHESRIDIRGSPPG
jgi:hypothetical protein